VFVGRNIPSSFPSLSGIKLTSLPYNDDNIDVWNKKNSVVENHFSDDIINNGLIFL
jgi:hypothetical protein